MKKIQMTKILMILILCTICLGIYGEGSDYPKKITNGILLNRTLKVPADTTTKDYIFKDTLDNIVRLSNFKGKFVFVDTWYSGCGFCIYANRALKAVHEQLKNENIVFLSVSIDADKRKWMASITKNAKPSSFNPWAGEYYPAPGTVILCIGGTSGNANYNQDNAFIKTFNPEHNYPKLLLFDCSGRLISDKLPRPDSLDYDRPEKLIAFLKRYLKSKP